jgi:hypothetical protein
MADNRVLVAARAYMEQAFPGLPVEVHEFGTPSLGPDDAETHFVTGRAGATQLLLRVVFMPGGDDHVEPLSAS